MDDALRRAVARAKESGDEAAYREIDACVRRGLRGFFTRGPWPPDEADDLVQKTLTRVYSSVRSLAAVDAFWPWLFAIARNVRTTAIADWEARRRTAPGGLELAPDPPDETSAGRLEERTAARQRLTALAAAIERLPDRQRQCLMLAARDGLAYEEIAAVLRLSVHTVRNHIAQARATLRRSEGGTEEGGA